MVFDRHGINTRNANSFKVTIPKPNIECFKRSFKYAGAKIWNNLSDELHNAPSLDSFKLLYKKKYFYSNRYIILIFIAFLKLVLVFLMV